MKLCTRCQHEKSATEFYKARRQKSGFHTWCKLCMRAFQEKWRRENPKAIQGYQSKRKYGITRDQRETMEQQQRNLCKICQRHGSEFVKGLVIDHSHSTGKVRGLLCSPCNQALGMLQERIDLLHRMEAYIKEFA